MNTETLAQATANSVDSAQQTAQAVMACCQHMMTQCPLRAGGAHGCTTGDLIAQMGLFQFGLLIAAFVAAAALVYLAMGVHRLSQTSPCCNESVSDKTPAAVPVVPEVVAQPTGIHPGLSDEKLAVLLATAVAVSLGPDHRVVRFRSAGATQWTPAQEKRVDMNVRVA